MIFDDALTQIRGVTTALSPLLAIVDCAAASHRSSLAAGPSMVEPRDSTSAAVPSSNICANTIVQYAVCKYNCLDSKDSLYTTDSVWWILWNPPYSRRCILYRTLYLGGTILCVTQNNSVFCAGTLYLWRYIFGRSLYVTVCTTKHQRNNFVHWTSFVFRWDNFVRLILRYCPPVTLPFVHQSILWFVLDLVREGGTACLEIGGMDSTWAL